MHWQDGKVIGIISCLVAVEGGDPCIGGQDHVQYWLVVIVIVAEGRCWIVWELDQINSIYQECFRVEKHHVQG